VSNDLECTKVRVIAALGLVVLTSAAGGPQGRPPSTPTLRSAVADVEAGRQSTPLLGEPGPDGSVTVTFLARRGRGPVPRIVSDATGWGEQPDDSFSFKTGTMTRLGIRDWYFLQCQVAPRARIEYLVARGITNYKTDPYNPRRRRMAAGLEKSEFVVPGYQPPPSLEAVPASPAGRIEEVTVPSRALGSPRPAAIYTPPGFDPTGEHPLAVFLHGAAVLESGQAGQVLEWLAARHMIEPPILVTVNAADDAGGLLPEEALKTFLTEELPAWLSSRYSVSRDASKRAILGISFNARNALDAALTPGEAFGAVGLLIPGRRLRPEAIDALTARRITPRRAFVLGGLYDAPNLPTARLLRAALERTGHDVEYLEVPEGHNQATWRHHLADAFITLFGTRRSSSILPRTS
jgi:enterochelin esterase-like enzyme